MANVSVDTNVSNIVVSTSQSNITVSDDGVIVSNITVLESNINVGSTQNIINVAEIAAVSDADVRAALGNTAPILYNVSTGIFSFDSNAAFSGKTTDDLAEGSTNLYFTNARVDARVPTSILNSNITLKQYRDTVFDNGNISGNVTINVANGAMHKANIAGNITGISVANVAAGTSLLVVLEQDAVGLAYLDTTTFASNWTNWKFVNDDTALNAAPNGISYLGIVYDGEYYHLSVLTDAGGDLIPNSQLANSNVIINGITIPLGSSATLTTANIAENTNLYFTAARARGNVSATDAGGLGSFAYNNSTGVFTYTGPSDSDVRNLLSNTSPITYSSATGIIGLSSTASITTTGNISGGYILGNGSQLTGVTSLTNAQVLAHIATQPLTVGGNLTVNGNINATGNINVQNVEDLYVRDQTIVMNANAASPANVQIVANRPGFANVELKWNEQSDRWTFTNDGTTYFNLPTSTTDVAEGTNLYYSNARVNSFIQNNITTTDIDEGTNLYFTDARVRGNVSATTATGIAYDSGNGVFSLASIPNSSLSNNSITINGTSVSLGGTRTLTTTDIAEGTNLYYTTQRVRSNISVTVGSPSGNGNLSYDNSNGVFTFTPADASAAGTVTQINTGENLTGGPITATGTIGMANALANVSTITAEATKNITLNTANALVTQQKYNNTDVFSGNISSDGYAFFDAGTYTGNAVTSYSGVANIENFVFNTGNTTSGSNAITGVSLYQYVINVTTANIAANISNVAVNSLFTVNEDSPYPFPQNTVVTSVDAANSTIYMSANATASANLTLGSIAYFINSALIDTTTGQAIAVYSQFDGTGSGSKTTLIGSQPLFISKYGYPKSGFSIGDFDVFTAGVAGNYTLGNITKHFIGRNKVEAPNSVLAAPRGLVVGNADLTGRAENDSLPNFGINVLWDGLANVTTDYAGNTPVTQVLLKQYSDNSSAGSAGFATTLGPRIFFTSARGNKNLPYTETYPRKDDELGRVTWWGSTQILASPGTVGPPGWISGVAGQDNLTTNSGLGMYFGISPNTANFNRSLYMASTMGNTLIASAQDSTGSQRPIIFAPSHFGTSQGNSVYLYNQTVTGTDTVIDTTSPSGTHFAQINYANTTGLTGAKISVTNGNNFNSNREGNIALSIDRNLTTANSTVRSRIGVNYLGSSTPDRIRFTLAPDGLANATPVTISGFTNTTVAGALNGNVFYVKGPFITGSFRDYEIYTDSGLTTGVNLGVTNVNAGPGNIAYTRTNGVTAKDWSWVLPQSSNSLILTEDGVTRTTFAGDNITTVGTVNAGYFVGDGSNITNINYSNANVQQYLAFGLGSNNINTTGNITAGYFLGNGSQLTGLTTTQVTEGTNLYYSNARARASISGTGDISYDANTGVISYTGTPGDITDVIAGDGLTGGGTSGNVTLTVGAGTGITVNADNVAVNMGAFTTTNLAEGANLYYTDTRANSAIDTRVNKAFVEGLGVSYTSLTDKPSIPTHTSNLTNDSGFITTATANVISVNTKTGTVVLNTGDIAESGNLYFSNARARQSISGTGDISYDANTGVISYTGTPGDITDVIAGSGLTGGGSTGNVTLNVGAGTGITVNADNIAVNMSAFSTTDLVEGANLYFTTARANTAIGAYQGNINTTGNITAGTLLGDGSNISYVRAFSADLVTDSGPNGLNVILESQSNNRLAKADSDSFRYVPSTRTVLVTDGFIGSSAANTSFSGNNLLLTGNINATLGNMSVGNITVNTVTAGFLSGNGSLITNITGANVFGLSTTQVSEGTNLYYSNTRVNAFIQNNITTTDIDEGTNLYYTDTRANSAIDTRVNKAFVEALNVSYTSLANTPTNVSAFTNDAGYLVAANLASLTANVTSINGETGVVVLDTGDIAENGNLYFTTARANTAIAAYQGNINTAGTLRANSVTVHGTTNVSLQVYDNTLGTSSGGMYFNVGGVTDVNAGFGVLRPVAGATTFLLWNEATDKWQFTNDGSTFYNMATSTTDLAEGTNLYYTDARANTNSNAWLTTKTTTDLVEGANLYYSNVRVNAFIQNNITTSDIDEGTNLYFTTDRANTAIGAYQGSISTTGNIATTGNITAGYFSGNGSLLTGITSSYGNSNVTTLLANFGSNTISTTGNITAGNTIVNGVSFNTAGTTSPSSGQIVYNSNYGTHQVGLNGSNVMLMGQDLVVYARNAEANTLVKGEVVRISGATGDKATVSRAINNSDANSATSIGIVKQDIAAGQLGYIVSQGVVDGINLGAYTAGDLLYLGNVAGTFTNVKPSAPQHIVFIGVVERANAGNGQIFVRVQNGFELNEIHDVQITSLQANDMLIRNTGNTLWINQNFGTTVTNSNITLKQFQETRVNLGSTGGNITLNMANGSIFAMTATSNISNIALSNAGVGASGTLIITQDGTGSRLLTVTGAWKFAGASKTLSTAANTIDIVNFFTDGTTVYAALSKGYA